MGLSEIYTRLPSRFFGSTKKNFRPEVYADKCKKHRRKSQLVWRGRFFATENYKSKWLVTQAHPLSELNLLSLSFIAGETLNFEEQ